MLKTGFGNSPYADTLSYAYGTVAAITTTSFKMFEGNVDTVKQCSWLAFGVQQWGLASSYPIAFSTWVVKIYKRGSASNNDYNTIIVSTTELTSIGASSGVNYNFLAIGIQQWGNSSSNTFPVSFTNTDWKMAGLMTSSHYDYTSAVISKSQNGFQNGSWGNPYDYIVIGIQQWGASLATTQATVTYPLAFTVIFSCVCNGVGSASFYINAPSATGFTWHDFGASANRVGTWWIAVGKQEQWGFDAHTGQTSNYTTTFPISFPDMCYTVVGSRSNGGTESYWTFCIATNSVTKTQFKTHLSQNLYWIALGK